jgi:hypothetical protein
VFDEIEALDAPVLLHSSDKNGLGQEFAARWHRLTRQGFDCSKQLLVLRLLVAETQQRLQRDPSPNQ